MRTVSRIFRILTEGVAAAMMAAIFCIFILQIAVRYVVGSEWFASVLGGTFDAAHFGWTVEFILVLWLWSIFWGNSFVVRDSDHVTFDIIYYCFGRKARTVLVIIGALIIVAALWSSIGPTYERMRLLHLKSSATLPVKMFPIYSIYFLFLAVVGLRYLWRAWDAARYGADREAHTLPREEPVEQEDEA